MEDDSYHTPSGVPSRTFPVPLPVRRRHGCLRKALALGMSLLVLGGLLSVWLIPYVQYQSSHNIPNPFWGVFGKTITYTPEQGPPGPELLDSRPEGVILHFIADYQKLAGTYPCAQDLALYDDAHDPVLDGHSCAVHRPIAFVSVRSVQIGPAEYAPEVVGPFRGVQGDVHVEIAYTDGTRHTMTLSVRPNKYQYYWFTYLHLDCWGSIGISSLYPKQVPQVPKGAEYGLDAQGNSLCQG
ncbi:MAG TPA: hypothetical protein VFN11_14470 [Ktedonobacterales bacterium]|nr:hypothetical protein [Ktedonobacterales bacterium]